MDLELRVIRLEVFLGQLLEELARTQVELADAKQQLNALAPGTYH